MHDPDFGDAWIDREHIGDRGTEDSEPCAGLGHRQQLQHIVLGDQIPEADRRQRGAAQVQRFGQSLYERAPRGQRTQMIWITREDQTEPEPQPENPAGELGEHHRRCRETDDRFPMQRPRRRQRDPPDHLHGRLAQRSPTRRMQDGQQQIGCRDRDQHNADDNRKDRHRASVGVGAPSVRTRGPRKWTTSSAVITANRRSPGG